MFLDFNPGIKRKAAALKVPPFIPDIGWRPPTNLPDIRDATLIAFDVETKETDFEHGAGWARNAGHIVGFSIAAVDRHNNRFKTYCPIRHEVQREWNLDPAYCLAWAKQMLETPVPKTGANLMYDTGWFTEENIFVQGPLYDVQFAQALLNEHERVGLDILAQKYLQRGKSSNLLYEWCARAYGGNPTPKQRANIWRAPPSIVGEYGEDDADLCLDILPRMWAELEQQELTDLFRLECRMIPILIKMRRAGVRIDLNYADQLYSELGRDLAEANERLRYASGMTVNVNSGAELARLFDHVGIPYPRTEAGAPSFQKDFLKNLEHPVGKMVNEIREIDKIRSTFVRSYMLEKNVNGKIHGSLHPLKGDDGGTKTGRLAASDPNLQNIPVRSKTGQKVRKAFVPDYGHMEWEKNDYSQIEYRFLAHFAVDRGDGSAQRLRDTYINDPTVDYHDVVYDAACPFMGWDITDKELRADRRRPIKNTNFGLVYGQGQGKLARTMGLTPAQSKTFFGAFHSAAPYVLPTMEMCASEVHATGVVKTILGRKTHFVEWVPINDRDAMPLPWEQAIRRYGSAIKRAYDYRAINYKLQGSAADMMKRAMIACDDSGVFDVTGIPRLTVHDELDFSVIDDTPSRRDAHAFMRHTLETAIPLHIPVRVDATRGPTWGHAK